MIPPLAFLGLWLLAVGTAGALDQYYHPLCPKCRNGRCGLRIGPDHAICKRHGIVAAPRYFH